jgi:transcriptional regulator CtsR
MKQLIIGLTIGLAVGLTCTACSIAKGIITAEPMQVVLTERNHVTTTRVTTEEGTYRIFTIESSDGKGGVGISAIKIK